LQKNKQKKNGLAIKRETQFIHTFTFPAFHNTMVNNLIHSSNIESITHSYTKTTDREFTKILSPDKKVEKTGQYEKIKSFF